MSCCCNNRRCCNCCNCKMRCHNTTSCSDECRIRPVSGCPCNGKCTCEGSVWYPIEETQERTLRMCCDQNGCCGLYPADCRNTFWPDFAHPRWLCCKDLYCVHRKAQMPRSKNC